MATPNPPIESHSSHCQRLLEHAEQQLDSGDRDQAAEKIWGAAAHKLAEIANTRGWPLESHADNRFVAHYIAECADEPAIVGRFDSAEAAHRAFYRDDLTIPELRNRLAMVRELIDLLDDAHRDYDKLPPDLEPPTDPRYRARHPQFLDPGKQRDINIEVQEMARLRKGFTNQDRQLAALRAANATLAAAQEADQEAGQADA